MSCFDDFIFSIGEEEPLGTGCLIFSQYILTCAHILDRYSQGEKVKIKRFSDSEEYDALIAWRPPEYEPKDDESADPSDIAILKILGQVCNLTNQLTSQCFLDKDFFLQVSSLSEEEKQTSARGFPSKESALRDFTLKYMLTDGRAMLAPNDLKHVSGPKVSGFSGAPVFYKVGQNTEFVGIIAVGSSAIESERQEGQKGWAHIIVAPTLKDKGIFDFIYKDSLLELLKPWLSRLKEGVLLDVCRILNHLFEGEVFKYEVENPSDIKIENALEKLILIKSNEISLQANFKKSEFRIFQFAAIFLWCSGKGNDLFVLLERWIQEHHEESSFVIEESRKIVILYQRCMRERDYLESRIIEISKAEKELRQSRDSLEVTISKIDERVSKVSKDEKELKQNQDVLKTQMSEIKRQQEVFEYRLSLKGKESSLQALNEGIRFWSSESIIKCFFLSILASFSITSAAMQRAVEISKLNVTPIAGVESTSKTEASPTPKSDPISEAQPVPTVEPTSEPTQAPAVEAPSKPKAPTTPESAPVSETKPVPMVEPNPKLASPRIPNSEPTLDQAETLIEEQKSTVENSFEKDWINRNKAPEAECGAEHFKENYSPEKRVYPVFLDSSPEKMKGDLRILKERFCTKVVGREDNSIQIATIVGKEDALLFKAFLEKNLPKERNIRLGKPE